MNVMDYKYIQQLVDSYFACRTTAEEEKILREFFSQQDVPAGLLRYKALFDFQTQARQVRLGSDFDGIPTPKGLEGAGKMPLLDDAFKKAGFPASQREKIFSGNVLRLYRDTLPQ